MNSKTIAIFCVILATILWGVNFHFAKIMLKESNFIEAGFWRYILGVGALIIFSLNSLPKLETLKAHWWKLLLVGLIGLFGFNLFFFLALQYTSPLNAALIVSLNPIVTIILSHFILKTPITQLQLLGALVALCGALILLTQGDVEVLAAMRFAKGDLIMLVAITMFSLYHVWTNKYGKGIDNRQFTLATNAVCLVGFVIAALFTTIKTPTSYSQTFWLATIGNGVLATAVAYLLWNKGVAYIGADKAALYMNIVPFTASVAALFFDVQLHTYHLVSGITIIAGIVITQPSYYAGYLKKK